MHVSRKQGGPIAPVGWSDRDTDYEKENNARENYKHKEAVSVIASDSKRFKWLKQKILRGLRSQSSRKYETEYGLGSESLPNVVGMA